MPRDPHQRDLFPRPLPLSVSGGSPYSSAERYTMEKDARSTGHPDLFSDCASHATSSDPAQAFRQGWMLVRLDALAAGEEQGEQLARQWATARGVRFLDQGGEVVTEVMFDKELYRGSARTLMAALDLLASRVSHRLPARSAPPSLPAPKARSL